MLPSRRSWVVAPGLVAGTGWGEFPVDTLGRCSDPYSGARIGTGWYPAADHADAEAGGAFIAAPNPRRSLPIRVGIEVQRKLAKGVVEAAPMN